jgi:annexin A7/11
LNFNFILLKNEILKFENDESEFVNILCTKSFRHIYAIVDAYSRKSKNDIEKLIKKEVVGSVGRACLAIIRSVNNPSEYFATVLHDTMAGKEYIF